MKKNIKCLVSYDGSNYDGWQRLNNKDHDRSIQHIIESCLSDILSCSIRIYGSGRTDKGVHAMGQVFHFSYEGDKNLDNIKQKLNELLAEDIRILLIEEVDKEFHSRLSAKSKTYEYYLVKESNRSVFSRKYTYIVEDSISIDKMREASKYLIGTYDYKSFSTEKKNQTSTVRTIEDIRIEVICNHHTYYKEQICIQVKGNGFLYNMVRIIVGTLIEVGKREKRPEDMKTILEGKQRSLAGPMANYEGLFMRKVEY